MRTPLLVLLAAAVAMLTAGPAGAQSPRLVTVGQFEAPTYVTAPPGDARRLMVVEQAGRVRVVLDGRPLAEPFLDISTDVRSGGERGLLSIAFAPDYASSGRVYVYYTDATGDIRVDELRRSAASADRVDPATRRSVITQPHREYANHNGGQLQFGPDRLLYVGLGDGGGAGDPLRSGQNLGTLLGKLLRIDPRPTGGAAYGVPADNPFAGRPGARPEVYSYGLRNPFRFSFDRQIGDLTIGDVGQNEVEEIDFAARAESAGDNYGWNCFEGSRRYASPACDPPDHVRPVIERLHSQGDCSITGGYVVRDPTLSALSGRYLYGDYCTGALRSAVLETGAARDDRSTGLTVQQLSSFGEDACGRVYAASLAGRVSRIEGEGSECTESQVTPPPGGGGEPPPPIVAAPALDRTPPSIRAATGRRQRPLRRARVTVRVRCNEPCRLSAAARIRIAGSRRTLRARGARARPAGAVTVRLTLRLGRRELARIGSALRAGRRVSAAFTLRAVDVAGNSATIVKRVRLVRA